uniref:Uncharacterized protein n=1 Tax=Panagrellus redivivus TaxID=6233 RepID=A0A7E4VQT7_PANRE
MFYESKDPLLPTRKTEPAQDSSPSPQLYNFFTIKPLLSFFLNQNALTNPAPFSKDKSRDFLIEIGLENANFSEREIYILSWLFLFRNSVHRFMLVMVSILFFGFLYFT